MNTSIDHNQAWFERAQQTTPGGVNSPVRAFKSVGGTPKFIKHAKGAYLFDENNVQYVDYIGSWGSAILGHAPASIINAISHALPNGFSFGAPTALEVEFAETLCKALPSMQQVRLVSSGSEATMSAIRLARGFTNRETIIKFEGCYHGHADSLLVKAGSGLLTLGIPSSGGVPACLAEKTVVLPFNNPQALTDCFAQLGDQIAAVIVEPIAGNMNLIRGSHEFLNQMRALCDRFGSVLIFDEVMTGFRVGPQSAQGLYNITPDLTTLGKIIGGGFPLAAFGGRADIMQHLAPVGSIYQAGTLSGNPIAVTAGLATLHAIAAQPNFYAQLQAHTKATIQSIVQAAKAVDITMSADAVGGMFGLYFSPTIPTSFTQMGQGDGQMFKRFFHAMLSQGVYLAPSYFEAGFVSICHTETELQKTQLAAQRAFEQLSSR